MALCNICIDLQGGRKCRKIAWSNRGPHIPVGYAGTQVQGVETQAFTGCVVIPIVPDLLGKKHTERQTFQVFKTWKV